MNMNIIIKSIFGASLVGLILALGYFFDFCSGIFFSDLQPVTLAIIPVRKYLDTVTQKADILKENEGKSGLYLFTNKVNGKKYVGSAANLRIRLMQYFNPKYLDRKNYMYISRAILKHGVCNFSLAILEYCDPSLCTVRESFYISSLKPEYNILSIGGSSLGYNHTLETREKMSRSQKLLGRSGKNNPSYGAPVSEETRAKILKDLLQRPNCKIIEVFNVETNETTTYDSIRATARALDIPQSSISMYFKYSQTTPYKGKYIFKKLDK
jgi:hypothetical protein